MTTLQIEFPSHILAQVQCEMHDLKEDFLSFIYEINRNEKPVWTILKEMKDTVPTFIEQHILKVLALKYDTNRIKDLKRKMPKKSLINCRQQLNYLINAIEKENLLQEYVKSLVMIINNTTYRGQEMIYERLSNNWSNQIKNKILALMLLVYQFSFEKQKKSFNIVDLWYKIYPDTPIWQLKDERYSGSNTNNNDDINSESSESSQYSKDHIKMGKGSQKKINPKDDLISYELELLEVEFNRNLRISKTPITVITKKKCKTENKIQIDDLQNDNSSHRINEIYEDDSTTQEEESEEDQINRSQNYDDQNKVHLNEKIKQKKVQKNFKKQTRKNNYEIFSPEKQIQDLEFQFDNIHIETNQFMQQQQSSWNQDNLFQQETQFGNLQYIQNYNNSQHFFTFENQSHNNNSNIAQKANSFQPPQQQSTLTKVLSNKNSNSNIIPNSGYLITQQVYPNGQSQSDGDNNKSINYSDNQNLNQSGNQTTQLQHAQQFQQNQVPQFPILRNLCHKIVDIPMNDSSPCINYFISSQ